MDEAQLVSRTETAVASNIHHVNRQRTDGGLCFGLRFGGRACLHHLALRLVLWHYNYAPFNYVRFLDYATARIFLRKVGGGTSSCTACCSSISPLCIAVLSTIELELTKINSNVF